MIGAVVRKIFGSKNEREVKRLQPMVQQINGLEPEMQKLSDEQLRGKTAEFRERLEKGETLDDLLPEAFAVVREASRRVLGQRHYDVQMIGGMVLHSGKIAEMKTGEGKTLVGTLPVYLNALSGKGVHVVTVNDYLARRDSEWMGRVYNFLGMTVGVVLHDLDNAQRKAAYNCDITYGTNNEFGFDYLRDNMKYSLESMVQRELNFAIVDEVDSILIDEARTPLIISGPTEDSTDKYYVINQVIPRLKRDQDFSLDEEHRSVMLTDDGVQRVEKLLNLQNLYDASNIEVLHHVNQALRAHTLYKRDVDYVVKEGEVVIVDEFTGRLMPGRRWSDGLHQAVEAKEGVKIENENQTLATITFQNYFRMYNKLAGMTGTADTEAGEFHEIYKLDVVVIPTNRPMQRQDSPDVVYKGEKGKFRAIAAMIEELHKNKQPILVGTVSIEKSEKLSDLLKKKGIPHTVLNAKIHDKEAEIVAQAGRLGAVTISTNMAGRGTDIMLGGNPELLAKRDVNPEAEPERYEQVLAEYRAQCEEEKKKVLEIGGLAIVGTERHESRRIDNQLRGRAGRQGDPGLSRFFLSLEDDLLRIFGADRMTGLMERLGMEEDEPIEHGLVTRAIENAQKKVEARNFDIRKHLLEYDRVMNDQRTAIYAERLKILSGEGVRETFHTMLENVVEEITEGLAPEKVAGSEWDWAAVNEELMTQFGFQIELSDDEKDGLSPDAFYDMVLDKAEKLLSAKETEFTPTVYDYLLRQILITTLDHLWKDHLLAMDHLREGINLRAYGQKDPKQEYKKEGHQMFQEMVAVFRADVVEKMCKVQVRREVVAQQPPPQPGTVEPQTQVQPTAGTTEPTVETGPAPAPSPTLGQPLAAPKQERKLVYSHGSDGAPRDASKKEPVKGAEKVGRNEPCPCGSGKKYKQCHGKTAVTS